ncbi:MAG TPA: TerC/Alx family metal homeostasis membrane protein [Ignavibacteriaceae bacterium]|nr:TerC/Alx family metal homeostasis membrane protein [Ignavibacteriaceae bacterium]
MEREIIEWIVFWGIVAVLFFIDLYLSERRTEKISLKSSLIWSTIWTIAALIFNVFIFYDLGKERAVEFLTGYIIERSLSFDNLFVFLLIFDVMHIKPENQPHVLKWGILSAIVFRIVFIVAGVGLVNLFEPIIYVFGLILLYAAYKMAFGGDQKIDVEHNWLVRLAKKYMNLDSEYKGKKFFITKGGKKFATTIFLTFLLIESSDIVFAVDSIPAIIAITKDTFIIISSNIFAILGLRALYFALAALVDLFVYLKYGVAIILFYVGVKMLTAEFYHIPTEYSLILILAILVSSILLSLIFKKRITK